MRNLLLKRTQSRVRKVADLRGAQWTRFAGPAIILLAAAVAAAPIWLHGPVAGDDFEFHLVSWLNAQQGWLHGIAYPHWASSANFGAGEPRFVFYPPLTWMLGAALGLVLPWTLVPVVITFLLLAATGARSLGRRWRTLPQRWQVVLLFSPATLCLPPMTAPLLRRLRAGSGFRYCCSTQCATAIKTLRSGVGHWPGESWMDLHFHWRWWWRGAGFQTRRLA
jgi:hypothetical protein